MKSNKESIKHPSSSTSRNNRTFGKNKPVKCRIYGTLGDDYKPNMARKMYTAKYTEVL